jgi:predicted enzyme related to lactoylglutathione lyase
MLNLNSIMIGSAQPGALAKFYEKVLGRAPDWAQDDWYGWQVGDSFLSLGKHSDVKGKAKEPQRVIFNFETKHPKKEYARIKESGAMVVKELYQMEKTWIATFADPDGNYFQVMSPWKM